MSKTKKRNTGIIFLAYVHRYVFPILVFLLPAAFGGATYHLGIGIGCVLFAAYGLAGYLLRWKHIYCSYQNAYHKRMTPDRIDWSWVKKSDAYGIPLIFALIGAGLIGLYVLG